MENENTPIGLFDLLLGLCVGVVTILGAIAAVVTKFVQQGGRIDLLNQKVDAHDKAIEEEKTRGQKTDAVVAEVRSDIRLLVESSKRQEKMLEEMAEKRG